MKTIEVGKLLVSKQIQDGVDLGSFMEDLLSAAPCKNVIILTDLSIIKSMNSIPDAVLDSDKLRLTNTEWKDVLLPMPPRNYKATPVAYYKGIPVYAEFTSHSLFYTPCEKPRVDLIKKDIRICLSEEDDEYVFIIHDISYPVEQRKLPKFVFTDKGGSSAVRMNGKRIEISFEDYNKLKKVIAEYVGKTTKERYFWELPLQGYQFDWLE